MKISSLDKQLNLPPVPVERGKGGVGGQTMPPAVVAAGATVALSATAMLLKAPSGPADFDSAKVQRIAQAIRDGKFQVSPEAIADKLIANARELLGPSGRA